MSTPSNGLYTLQIDEDGDTYYIGPAQDNSDELGLYEHVSNRSAPAFKLTNAPGTDEYTLSCDGKWVSFNNELKLGLSQEDSEPWKLVPVANIGYVIKGGIENGYCWTRAAFAPEHPGLDLVPAKVCGECPKNCRCSYHNQCPEKDKGCPCKDPPPKDRIRSLVDKGTLATQGKTVLATCTGCPSHCDIVTFTRVHEHL